MTNRERAIWAVTWALIMAGITTLAILAIHPMGTAVRTASTAVQAGWLAGADGMLAAPVPVTAPAPRTCTFDGGGAIASGDAARTSDGKVWVCTDDGTLVRAGG